ncbi:MULTISPECIES: YhbY family RNA-binding protein [Burkholderiaceae]|uniref:YhbY family RNA-binding protein n=1 Tax=Burkholderiaceae TaxID=119060 RepID=UPI000968D26D|nr:MULTISPECIES: YhbY family RNA-binding protein [Burkholderiaceae]MCG1017864.1 YhbY family RNA-binding protein [Mycetohabitans sp. B4]SIT67667.1 putative RNA-binding protein, YhbY family [Burkholderia sp. b13]
MPALTLSYAERSALRSQAHPLKPVVLIGADGLTDAVLNEIDVHLNAHELIKIRVFGDERDERAALYDTICDRLSAAPIQHIGKLLVIWRPRRDDTAASAPRGTASRAPRTVQARRAVPQRNADVPSAGTARCAARRDTSTAGAAPRVVKVVKPSSTIRRPKPQLVKVLGNERVTAGGNVKKAKKRQTSPKRQHQSNK